MSQQASPNGGTPEVLTVESEFEALRASPPFRGPVESLDGNHCNDHIALLFESKAEQLASIVPFLRQGIERGERCIHVIDTLTEAELLAALFQPRHAGTKSGAMASVKFSYHGYEVLVTADGRVTLSDE